MLEHTSYTWECTLLTIIRIIRKFTVLIFLVHFVCFSKRHLNTKVISHFSQSNFSTSFCSLFIWASNSLFLEKILVQTFQSIILLWHVALWFLRTFSDRNLSWHLLHLKLFFGCLIRNSFCSNILWRVILWYLTFSFRI